MDSSTFLRGDCYLNGSHSSAASSKRDVSYSCGFCGYELNLISSNRNTSSIGSKYEKSIKSGIISFFCIDKSRFSEVDEVQCVPGFLWRYSFGLLGKRGKKIKLLCGKCRKHIGDAYCGASPTTITAGAASNPTQKCCRQYDIRIHALQPSSTHQSSLPLSCDFL